MKKNVVLLGMIFVLLVSSMVSVFADAVSYDMDKAGYYVYVATPDGGLNIRSGPGTEYDRIMEGRIPDGVPLYIEYVSGTWGLTSYNGHTGWVALKQTTTNPPAPPAPPETNVQPSTAAPDAQTPQSNPDTTAVPQESASNPAENNAEEVNNTNSATVIMISQILLVAILLILVIVLAVALIIVVNRKSRR